MGVSKLLHTRYRLNDLERSVLFYKEVLGLEEVRRHKSPRGSELVFLKAPESEETIELCHFPSSGPVEVQADLTHLAFEVSSFQPGRWVWHADLGRGLIKSVRTGARGSVSTLVVDFPGRGARTVVSTYVSPYDPAEDSPYDVDDSPSSD